MPNSTLPRPRAAAPWIERVPPLALVSLASSLLVICTVAFALSSARASGWSAWAEPLLAAVALAGVLLVPVRIGPLVSLATLAAFFGVELAAGSFENGIPASDIGVVFLLVGSLLAAAYVRLGLRRRETELELARDAISELTRRDRVTELLSGKRELTWLEAELTRSRRHHHQFTLILVRPDRMDSLGEGDELRIEVLEGLAEVIGHELRATDVALRYDATTFALILPETSTDGARLAAERIRLLLPQRFAAGVSLTISSGIATFPRDAATDDELTHVAQRALDRVIELGGNRTMCASVEEGGPAGWALAGATTDFPPAST